MRRVGPGDRFQDAVRPLRDSPAYRRYVAARLVSQTGSSMSPLALAFAVLEIGGGAGGIGIVLAVSMVAQMALMLLGGAIADHAPRSRIMITAHLISGVQQAVVAVLVITGRAQLWELVTASAVAGSVGGFFGPAAQGMVRQLVPVEMLREANALLRLTQNVIKVGAPAVSGVLIAVVGPGWAIAYDSATFFVAAWMLSRVRVPLTPIKNKHVLESLREGWSDFFSRRWLWIMVAQSAACCTPWLIGYQVLGPLYAKGHLGGAAAWGAVVAGFAAGLITGSLVVLLLRPQRVGLVACVAVSFEALPLAALAVHMSVPMLVVSAFVTGIGLDVSINTFGTYQQREVPPGMQARTSSYSLLGQQLPVPLGYVLAGPLAAAVGLVPALAGCAVVIVVIAFLPLLSSEVRAMRLPAPQPTPVPALPVEAAGAART
ncbi:MFS transporter [Actinomadura rupiterrae]|uniref:MFS transporter n=1 Tax=Actinomadura rupiterrae TaxID=559627 RepID=UPI0020A5DC6E|nr:MFS transporter [Actinomadura rupiterrae]MCP2342050.1 MFS family permease [Actinomadura rupiterrae]